MIVLGPVRNRDVVMMDFERKTNMLFLGLEM